MSKFPILKEAEEKAKQEPYLLEYSITAKGWKATGAIKYDPANERSFWSLLQMTVQSVMDVPNKGEPYTVTNESYTDGYSRYLAPVDLK